jgi:hypothetical protein
MLGSWQQKIRFLKSTAAAAVVFVLYADQAANAQFKDSPVTVERIEITRPGVYEIQTHGSVSDQSISTGSKVEVRGYKNLQSGSRIHARAGTVIGAELNIVGTPRRAKVPIKVVWRYPAPGLTNPDTKVAKTVDEYVDTKTIGEKFPVFWGLTQSWHLVPGTWTLEIWHGERKLGAQSFEITVP